MAGARVAGRLGCSVECPWLDAAHGSSATVACAAGMWMKTGREGKYTVYSVQCRYADKDTHTHITYTDIHGTPLAYHTYPRGSFGQGKATFSLFNFFQVAGVSLSHHPVHMDLCLTYQPMKFVSCDCDSAPRWCSLLCPEMHCLLCSPGIVENLPALERYECSPELAEQLHGSVVGMYLNDF